jgi:hypothetical protein
VKGSTQNSSSLFFLKEVHMLTGGPVQVHRILWLGENTVNVASTDTENSDPIKLTEIAGSFSLYMKASSVLGTVNISVIQQGTKEVIHGPSYDSPNVNFPFVTPNGASNIVSNTTTETFQLFSFSPEVMPWIRFAVTGAGSNNADTIFEGYLLVNS